MKSSRQNRHQTFDPAKPSNLFDWLLSLDPAGLHATITIQKEQRDFTEENWQEIASFAGKFSPEHTANLLLSVTETRHRKTVQRLVGASYYPGSWEPLPANFIKSLLQIEPETFAKREANPDILPGSIKELYPDCPVPDVMPEESGGDTKAPCPQNLPPARLLVEPRLEPGQAEITRMLGWISQLDPLHLLVKISLADAQATFDHRNWSQLPTFTRAHSSSPSGAVILYLTSPGKPPNDTHSTSIAGLSFQDEQWEAYGVSFLKMLPRLKPDLYADFLTLPNVTLVNVKDLFPDCPVTSDQIVEW